MFVLLAAMSVAMTRTFENVDKYGFGSPKIVDTLVQLLLFALAGTHLIVWLLMFARREEWLPTDEAMYRFIGIKAVFWINMATVYPPLGHGISLDSAVLFVLLMLTTVDLDIKLFRRYVLGREDEALAAIHAERLAHKKESDHGRREGEEGNGDAHHTDGGNSSVVLYLPGTKYP